MEPGVAALVERLLTRSSFHEGAEVLLCALLEAAEEAVGRAAWTGGATLLRGLVHLRPAGDYRGLVVVERVASPSGSSEAAVLPSVTAWKWIEAHRRAVAVDVHLARLTPLDGEGQPLDGGRSFDGKETVRSLRTRSATHVLALPLRVPGGVLAGMVSLEASCLAAVGDDSFWAPVADHLQLLCDVSAPGLVALPSAASALRSDDPLLPVVGAAMQPLIALLGVFAAQEETLLIAGPTGSGKSRLARWCHARSTRNRGPFQVVDLLTVPEDMQMAELFGWRKGAFTGALQSQQGTVARADGGTLFIDEIDKLSMKAQAGLLQLLETRTFRVLGDPGGVQRANVRFIVGTNANLASAVAAGSFREDLYYRINVLPVRLPPLVERADEIGAWAEFFAHRRHVEAVGSGRATVSAEAAMALARQPWPGNLRQLDNVVRRAYAMALVETEGRPEALTLQLRHVEQAVSFEFGGAEPGAGDTAGLMPELRRAARSFVEEALKLQRAGGELDLDLVDAFRGLVLSEAAARLGDVREVFLLFGKVKLVEGRNHMQTFRREVKRVNALAEAVGAPIDASDLEQSRG